MLNADRKLVTIITEAVLEGDGTPLKEMTADDLRALLS